MSENDGKNNAQLLKYACFESYLQSLIIYRGTSPNLAWHRDNTVDSLVLWLLWQTSRRGDDSANLVRNNADIVPESIRLEDWAYRQYLLGVLHSFIIAGYRVRLHPSVLFTVFIHCLCSIPRSMHWIVILHCLCAVVHN